MRRLDAHGKLLTLLFGLLLTSSSLLLLSGCGGGLLPEQQAQTTMPFQTYDQVVESFEQIVPGMTRAEDLPGLGFDARTGNADVLSYLGLQERFMPAAGVRWEHLNPAVRACIRAEQYCTGFVFRPSRTTSKRVGHTVSDLLGFQRITHSTRWSAEVILLVMNGRVVHKVFSGNPRIDNLDNKRQPLGPLQDVGGALSRAAGSATSF
jgi:hypothetical protein